MSRERYQEEDDSARLYPDMQIQIQQYGSLEKLRNYFRGEGTDALASNEQPMLLMLWDHLRNSPELQNNFLALLKERGRSVISDKIRRALFEKFTHTMLTLNTSQGRKAQFFCLNENNIAATTEFFPTVGPSILAYRSLLASFDTYKNNAEEVTALQQGIIPILGRVVGDHEVRLEDIKKLFKKLIKDYKNQENAFAPGADNSEELRAQFTRFIGEDNLKLLEKRGPVMKKLVGTLKSILKTVGLTKLADKLSKKKKLLDSIVKKDRKSQITM